MKLKGSDTFEKRKKAEKLGCKVTGTTGSCNEPKGTVERSGDEVAAAKAAPEPTARR